MCSCVCLPVLPRVRGEQRHQELPPHQGLLQEVLRTHPSIQEVPPEGSKVRTLVLFAWFSLRW